MYCLWEPGAEWELTSLTLDKVFFAIQKLSGEKLISDRGSKPAGTPGALASTAPRETDEDYGI
jgi:hypothetical protein